MAEELLLYVAEGIIGKLVSYGIQEIGLWWGVQGELDKLKDTVSSIQAVLLDAGSQEQLNHQDKDWVRKLKSAVYEADDLLDDFDAEVRRRQEVSGNSITKEVLLFFSCSNQVAYGISMGHKIKALRERLDTFVVDREKFSLKATIPNVGNGSFVRGRRDTESSTPEIIVGRVEDKKKVIELLMGSYEEHVWVLPIQGIGGLGKTTLAQMVFNDKEVESYFGVRLWVCVSDTFDVSVVVRKILESATREKVEDLQLNTLKDRLREKVGEKKCLLVLDDVWNEDEIKWGRLKNLISSIVGRGSRIIVTTRLLRVAEITRTLESYVLKELSVDESWSLLVKLLFRGQEPKSKPVIEIGKRIAKKCLGVPLVIKTIASILREKNPETKWLPFLENELSAVGHNENVVLTLKFSYDHLPLHLKRCFAYCALFPKDHKIRVQTLIHLWISHGFIQSSIPHPSLEDIGYRCFMDLLWRSFFQDVEGDVLGNVTTCKMHDLMHDLATSIAKPEISIINPIPNVDSIDEKIRHVSFHYNLESPTQIPSNLPITNSLRTFLLPSQFNDHSPRGWEDSKSKKFFSSLRRLRVLDLHNLGLENVPSSIENLKHLRYLDVSENEKMEVLPNSITKLQKLQILNLEGCEWLEKLPVDIGKLSSLRHLLCEGCNSLTHMPRGISQLTCLQSLTWFIVANDSLIHEKAGELSELNKLNELRRIEIRNLGYREHTHISEFEAANLKGKEYLESLVLRWNRDDANDSVNASFDESSLEILKPHTNLKKIEVYQYGGLRFPNWLSSLTNLIEIQIANCQECQYIPQLDQIPFLRVLHIEDLPELEFVNSEGNYIHESGTFFPSLEELFIQNCPNLKGWWEENGAIGSDDDNPAELPEFTSLSLLNIEDCPELSRLPLFTSVNQDINFVNANLEPLQQHMKMIPENPPVYIFALSHVVEISIEEIDGYQYLPSFHQIPSLKYLFLESLNDLEYISSKRDLYPYIDKTFFPSLKEIRIDSCDSLKGWWEDDDNNQDATATMALEFPQFPCLSKFEVDSCPNFTWVPGLSSLDQKLYLQEASMVTVQLPHLQYPNVGFLSWLPSLTKVVEIYVAECTCLCIPSLDQLPSLQALTFQSLLDLEYIEFDVSTSSSSASAFFPSLKTLSIGDCPSLEGWRKIRNCDDPEGDTTTLSTSGESLPEFHCLSSLAIRNCPMLISLPMSQTLAEKLVFDASNLKSFPSNISSLTNLREIRLESLTDLEYIEQGENDQIRGRRVSSFFPFLKELQIWECPVLKGWWKKGSYVNNLPQFPQLSVLSIWDCPSLTAIPRFPNHLDEKLHFRGCTARLLPSRLSSFANLREVSLSHLDDLEYIENEAGESTTLLPSLKRLRISNCSKLEGWWKMISNTSDNSTIGIQSALPHFPSLSYLELMDCPRFTLMPLFPTLEELSITRVSSEIFQRTLKMKPVSDLSTFPPLSNLKKLYIEDVADLEYMNCTVSPSLRGLRIYNCPILKGWWGNREEDAYDDASHFPGLCSLEIVDSPMLTSMPLFPNLDDELTLKNASIELLRQTMEMKIKMKGKRKLKTKVKALAASKSLFCSSSSSSSSSSSLVPDSCSSQAHPLRKLKQLQIERVEDFRTLPETWLKNLSSLETLDILDCPDITSVPQGLESWPKNLTSLTIKDCPNLTSMPQGLQSRTSLRVKISGCPQLNRA